jgi:uncharacterized protein YggT (Ycf19 family)
MPIYGIFLRFPRHPERRSHLNILFYFLSMIAFWLISLIQTMMMVRAIMSWFFLPEESGVLRVLTVLTEPFIVPVRALLQRIDALSSLPIDISFMVTFFLLSLLQTLL